MRCLALSDDLSPFTFDTAPLGPDRVVIDLRQLLERDIRAAGNATFASGPPLALHRFPLAAIGAVGNTWTTHKPPPGSHCFPLAEIGAVGNTKLASGPPLAPHRFPLVRGQEAALRFPLVRGSEAALRIPLPSLPARNYTSKSK